MKQAFIIPVKIEFNITKQADGYMAQAGTGNDIILTAGDTMEELKKNITEAVQCHFESLFQEAAR